MNFFGILPQYKKIKQGLDNRLQKVFENTQFINGNNVRELEEALANFVKVKHCITTSSGTSSLLVSLMALNIGQGDEVIVPDFTFYATAEVVSLLGAIPIFVDVDEATFNINYKEIEKNITNNTKAIIPVHLYGQCADMDKINDIAKKNNLKVISDSAQSFGAKYKGKDSCSIADISCTSFYPTKTLSSYGDAGACFTNNDNIAETIREICNHGSSKKYYHTRQGLNARISEIQACVILEKLKIFNDEINIRNEIAQYYNEKLKGFYKIPILKEDNYSVYSLYTLQLKDRDSIIKHLSNNNIPSAIHYPLPLSKQPFYKEKTNVENIVANSLSDKVLSIPIHPYLSKKDIKKVVNTLMSHKL